MRALLLLLIGGAIGAWLMRAYDERRWPAPPAAAPAGEAGAEVPTEESLRRQLAEWHLTGPEIRADLERGGEIARRKAAVAGAELSDVRIAAVIQAKYVLDREISPWSVGVRVHGGRVVLEGTVDSDAAVGRAVALALDTSGVTGVVSHLAVRPPVREA